MYKVTLFTPKTKMVSH